MRHFAANYIFDGEDLIKNSVVTVNNSGEIIYVGKENEGLTERPFQIFYNGIISPGFVNTHCHLELSDFEKTDEQGRGLVNFIKSVINKRNNPTDEKIISLADRRMFEKGVNLVGDIVNSAKTIDVKTISSIYYHSFVEMTGIKNSESNDRISFAENLIAEFQKKDLKTSVVPHSFYSISENILEYVRAKSTDDIVSVHFLESDLEYEFFSGEENSLYDFLKLIDSDFTPLANEIEQLYLLLAKFRKTKSTILVHNIKTENGKIPKDINCFLSLCPASNLYLHNKLPAAELIYQNLDKLTLGTDSLASNHELDILAELKLIDRKYPNIPLKILLKIITKNGADALCNYGFGRLAPGLKPGLILIENVDLINLQLNDKTRVKRII